MIESNTKRVYGFTGDAQDKEVVSDQFTCVVDDLCHALEHIKTGDNCAFRVTLTVFETKEGLTTPGTPEAFRALVERIRPHVSEAQALGFSIQDIADAVINAE